MSELLSMSELRSEVALVVQKARIAHAKSVDTMPDGEVNDLDHRGLTLDQAIADAVLVFFLIRGVP